MPGLLRRGGAAVVVCGLLGVAVAGAGTQVLEVTKFANPPGSMTYFDGFSGKVGETDVWPAEMGWEGERIDIAFELSKDVPAEARAYRFRVVITNHFDQSFDLAVRAGPALDDLAEMRVEYVDSARVLAATIPVERFKPGQTNWIRLEGRGVRVGYGEPAGIRWKRWLLSRTDLADDPETVRVGQFKRLVYYARDAIAGSSLVRDALPLSPDDDPTHPASPDAGGFALLALCVADRLGLSDEAEALTEAILSAYAGHTKGVNPDRNAKGFWWHWMDPQTGGRADGWGDAYTTIGSALLVSGALFAKNHFVGNADIAALADELYATTDFNAAIHPSLDGRIFLAMDEQGGEAFGSVGPWNEYALIVTLALRQEHNDRALAVRDKWLEPANLPTIAYRGIPTLTDNRSVFAPAFWVQQQYFFSADFSTNADFVRLFANQRQADALYCAADVGQAYRYGLTAGVSPSGYTVDRIYNHHNVFAPEAVAAWGDFDSLLEFAQDQPPRSDPRLRYGLTRVSASDRKWIPFDAGLVDHLFLLYGLTETVEPLFFKQRQPFQADADGDGMADAYDNCPDAWNPRQEDSDGDGIGDACTCRTPWADADGDGDVDLRDFAVWQACPRVKNGMPERCLCADRDGDHGLGGLDLDAFGACLDGSGPDVPADADCGR